MYFEMEREPKQSTKILSHHLFYIEPGQSSCQQRLFQTVEIIVSKGRINQFIIFKQQSTSYFSNLSLT